MRGATGGETGGRGRVLLVVLQRHICVIVPLVLLFLKNSVILCVSADNPNSILTSRQIAADVAWAYASFDAWAATTLWRGYRLKGGGFLEGKDAIEYIGLAFLCIVHGATFALGTVYAKDDGYLLRSLYITCGSLISLFLPWLLVCEAEIKGDTAM